MNFNKDVSIQPLMLFNIGEAGVRKLHLMKTINRFLTKNINFSSQSLDKPKVFIIAIARVEGISINGTAINLGLSIPLKVNVYTLPRLSDSERAKLCSLYSEVSVVLH